MPAVSDLTTSMVDLFATLSRSADAADAAGRPAPEAIAALRASGILGLIVPVEYGGLGLSALEVNRTVADLARADASAAIIVFQHLAVSARIVDWATEEQKRDLLPGAAAGSTIFASAWSETGAGAHKRRLATWATPDADGSWLLDGSKSFATGAGLADLYLVLAQSSDASDSGSTYGGAGQTFFLVRRDNPGLVAELGMDLCGMRGSATGYVHLRECRVPGSAVLGPVQEAARVIASVREGGATLGAVSVGIAQAAVDALITHWTGAGRAVSPAVQYQLVDLATRVEAARAIVERAGRRDGVDPGMTTLHSKVFASVTAEAVVADAARMFGGAGFGRAHPINRLARDVRAVALMGPTNDVCRELLRSQWMN